MSTSYRLDKKRSRFTVHVRASGVLRGFGHNPTTAVRDFSGTLDFDPRKPESSSLEISVKANSLEVTDDIKKKDRLDIERQMRDEVLEIGAHPEITFHSTSISVEEAGDNLYRVQMSGDLSLHGVTKQQRIDALANVRDDEVKLSGDFTLNQSDYKIKQVSALAGALKVKDELQFSFDIKGNRE
jgi:polyisoprenoid-binding protein YceI